MKKTDQRTTAYTVLRTHTMSRRRDSKRIPARKVVRVHAARMRLSAAFSALSAMSSAFHGLVFRVIMKHVQVEIIDGRIQRLRASIIQKIVRSSGRMGHVHFQPQHEIRNKAIWFYAVMSIKYASF